MLWTVTNGQHSAAGLSLFSDLKVVLTFSHQISLIWKIFSPTLEISVNAIDIMFKMQILVHQRGHQLVSEGVAAVQLQCSQGMLTFMLYDVFVLY